MTNNKKYHRLIRIIYFLLSIFLVISIISIVAYLIIMVFSGFQNLVMVPVDLPVTLESAMKMVTLHGDNVTGTASVADITLLMSESPRWFIVYAQLHFMGLFLISFYGVFQLWLVFKSMRTHSRNDYPFKTSYVKNIRRISVAFFIWSGWQLLFYFITNYFIKSIELGQKPVELRFNWDILMAVLWGFVILALAEIFRLGTELKKENELTV